ncbi:MAG: hypothetical protein JNL13_05255 [Chitinophagaceae bacterium]|nr:hypothetical protein [Chitinophagaceae bacterium]
MIKFKDLLNRRQADLQQTEGLSRWQEKIIAIQRNCARWMQCKTERLSLTTKRVLLFMFLITSASLSTYLLIKPAGKNLIGSGRITLPAKPLVPANSEFLNEAEYNKLKSFRQYMDSLARSPDRSKAYREFDRVHPGLLDSIRTLEQLYDLHIKNRRKWK